jgi:probable HAF family extracellular repeat protein
VFSAINVPHATFTAARGVNNHGIIVGSFGATSSETEGFVTQTKGFEVIAISGATYTDASGINDSDLVVGNYIPSGANSSSNGYVWNFQTGSKTLDYPDSQSTSINAVNNADQMTGQTSPPFISAFLYSDGQWTDFYYPDAFTSTGDGINNQAQIVGIYSPSNPDLPEEGFLRDSDGNFQEINFPSSNGSAALGINDGGTIVGYFTTSSGVTHGFVATPVAK